MKTMGMSKVWPDTYDEGHMHQFQLEHSQNSLAAAGELSLKVSSHGTSLKWSWRLSQSAEELS